MVVDIPPARLAESLAVIRRLPVIVSLLGFVVLGTGLLGNLHLRTHLLERGRANLGKVDRSHSIPAEDSCELCVQLHLPVLSAGWVPLLVCLGLFVAFLTLLAPRLTPQPTLLRLGCRGPPVL